MMSDVLVALIVALISPSVLHLLTQHSTNEFRRQDWLRQDKVAMNVIAAANKVAYQNVTIKEDTDQKLEVIRADVNSNLTAVKAEVAALREQLKSLGVTPVTDKEKES